jgi:hypothetical protein
MSASYSLLQASGALVSAVPLAHVVRSLLSLSALAGLLMLFRPLLVGIARALVLAARPRRSKEQQAARRNAFMLQRGINSAGSPVDTAELCASASRG